VVILAKVGSTRHDIESRRGRALALVATISMLTLAIVWWQGTLGWGGGSRPHRSALRGMAISWPPESQAAIAVLGEGRRVSHPATERSPIASVAKVMTAYVVLRRFPFAGADNGFSLTLTDADARMSTTDAAQGQSYVRVEPGETLTEREALEALLLPSANNIAMTLADKVAGDVPAFVSLMNQQAAALGMRDTTYTDPSGLATSTVSTAADQLRLARAALRLPALTAILALPQATIPVAGLITNTNSLLGEDGFVAGKTGSDSAAGGCFMFMAVRQAGPRHVTIVGVVLGQHGESLIEAGLSAADHLVNDVAAHLRARGL
jgi:D-alanyl-D-alanine carboxypeptidase (penicillin-binding protein 5/6)